MNQNQPNARTMELVIVVIVVERIYQGCVELKIQQNAKDMKISINKLRSDGFLYESSNTKRAAHVFLAFKTYVK